MTETLRDWMLEPWTGALPFEEPWYPPGIEPGASRIQVFTALGSMDTGGYGIISGGGTYGRQGLNMDEAHAWWELRAFVSGWLMGTQFADDAWLAGAVEEERARVRALVEDQAEEQMRSVR